MDKYDCVEGDIWQITPDHENFPGFLFVVKDPKDWGAQGYLMSSRDFDAYKYKGRAFLRVNFEDAEYCGKLCWIEEEEDDED